MKEIFLLKQGELVLKGMNRSKFENALISDVKRRLAEAGEFELCSAQSTLYVEPLGDTDTDAAHSALRKVFGVAALSRAAAVPKDAESIFGAAAEYPARELSSAGTFKCEGKRSDKSFPLNSPALCAGAGERILRTYPHLKVDVHNPDVTVYIEVRERAAYIHTAPERGAGGLPAGTSGRAALLLSGGIDSPAAGYVMAKRGLSLMPVHFFSYPYTGEESREKVVKLARILSEYAGNRHLRIVPFTEIQESIRGNCPERVFTLVMRRFMNRIAERLALENDCGALISGESLGQVASQTMAAMAVTGEVLKMPIFRPFVGSDKEEIVKLARKIGTFETSILPYDDCCTVFTPKRPLTRPKLEDVTAAEERLGVEELVNNAVNNTEKLKL